MEQDPKWHRMSFLFVSLKIDFIFEEYFLE